MEIKDIKQGDIVHFPITTAGFFGLLPVEEVSEMAFKVEGSWIPFSMVKSSRKEVAVLADIPYISIIIVSWFDRKLRTRRYNI